VQGLVGVDAQFEGVAGGVEGVVECLFESGAGEEGFLEEEFSGEVLGLGEGVEDVGGEVVADGREVRGGCGSG